MRNLYLIFLLTFIFSFLNTSAQNSYNLCNATITSDTTGFLYDSGGPSLDYSVSEHCTFLISIPCAQSISLSFLQFNAEANYDSLYVYDGQDSLAPLILGCSGNFIPPSVTAYSGYIFFKWISDPSVTYPGFEAQWTSVLISGQISIADFAMSDTNPAFNSPVYFNNLSNGSQFLWDFGDGSISTLQNPVHTYLQSGIHQVQLISNNCYGSDTISKQINIKCPSVIQTIPSSLTATVVCGSTVNQTLYIQDSSSCGVHFNVNQNTIDSNIQMLVMTYGTDQFEELPRTLGAIKYHIHNISIIQTTSMDPNFIDSVLNTMDVLLIPEHESGNSAFWNPIYPVLKKFLHRGKSIIWCGSNSAYSSYMLNSGIWSGTVDTTYTLGYYKIVLPKHPIVKGLKDSIPPSNAVYPIQFTDTAVVSILTLPTSDIATYKIYDGGKAIFLAYDFYQPDIYSSHVISNAVRWAGLYLNPSFISGASVSDSVSGGNSYNYNVTFQAAGLNPGTYIDYISILSNDTAHPVLLVPCTLIVTAGSTLSLSDTCINFGNVPANQDSVKYLVLKNSGCATMQISNMINSNPYFSINTPTNFTLLPGDSSITEINFNSDSIGTYLDSITIQTTNGDSIVCLSATVVVSFVENFENDSRLILFPNPSHKEIYFKSEYLVKSISIYDAYGRNIKTEFITTGNKINIENLSGGFYVIEFNTSKGRIIRRFLKN